MESKAIVIREIDSTETFKRAAESTLSWALTADRNDGPTYVFDAQ